MADCKIFTVMTRLHFSGGERIFREARVRKIRFSLLTRGAAVEFPRTDPDIRTSNIIDVDAPACNYGGDSFNGAVLRMTGYANDMCISRSTRTECALSRDINAKRRNHSFTRFTDVHYHDSRISARLKIDSICWSNRFVE